MTNTKTLRCRDWLFKPVN